MSNAINDINRYPEDPKISLNQEASFLLKRPIEIISILGKFLNVQDIARLSMTCRMTEQFPPLIAEQIKEELRDEVRQISNYSNEHFSPSVQSFKEKSFEEIEGLKIQNASNVITRIQIHFMQFCQQLGMREIEQFQEAEKTRFKLNRLKDAFALTLLVSQPEKMENALAEIKRIIQTTA